MIEIRIRSENIHPVDNVLLGFEELLATNYSLLLIVNLSAWNASVVCRYCLFVTIFFHSYPFL